MWPKKGFQRSFFYLRERISRMSASTHSLSLGLACGAAASMTPFIGFHFFLAAILAYLIGANLFASAIGTIVGNPWSFPFIWAANASLGNLIIVQFGLEPWLSNIDAAVASDVPVAFFYKITMGGVALGILTFPIYYGLSYWGLYSWRNHRQKRLAKKRAEASLRQEPVAPDLGVHHPSKPATEDKSTVL
ncbi:MAG: DUF2062 domain-containing protein [Candidatus Puniceispirillaceae bacterium]